ncbi:MAG: TIGR03617 family F420-dependent LLM class oxidoreductase [bacterium]|nr:TIGR03617 family F420-dependent LLM class oxidoreductase [Gammaproteobacteria bacterium]HIL97694.1 TIGR03617 family F420-dependent LLM class oxidoreductase [Pseudomonadales bacterium]
MHVITSITGQDLNQVGEVAKSLEDRGYYGVSTQENRFDPFLPHAIAATTTSTLKLRTSIAIAFSRSPMAVANTAWDLQTVSKGRFTLGLGSQVKGHNVRRFSVPWSPPAPRMREYVQSLKAIWSCWQTGEKLDYQGEHYKFSLMTPNFTPPALTCEPPAVQIAAVGPAMMKVAAEECDGVQLHAFCTRKYLDQVVIPRLEGALAKSERSRQGFEISGGGFVVTGADDEAVDKMFEWVRMRVGFYGSTPSYWPVFEVHGLEDLGHKLNDMSKKGQWDEMTREIPDDVVRLFSAVGRHDEIASAIQDRFVGVSDLLACGVDLPVGLIQELENLG